MLVSKLIGLHDATPVLILRFTATPIKGVAGRVMPPNNEFNRMHWAKKHKLVQLWRRAVKVGVLQQGTTHPLREPPFTVEITQRCGRGFRFYDSANIIALVDKLVIDSLVDIGFIGGDSHLHINGYLCKWERTKTDNDEVEVRLT
jgi:hypothetical protein